MISVIEVYNTVRDLCNKDQKGFVTPKVFNSFAEVAQQSVFNEMFKELSMAKQLRSRGLDPSGADSSYRGVKDDLSNFTEQVLYDQNDSPLLYVSANVFKRPLDLYNTEKIPQILNSNLSAPTAAFPVALISRDIEVFPSDEAFDGSLVITYYRNPASLTLSGVLDTSQGPKIITSGNPDSDGFFVLNPSSSRHFELPERFKAEVISEIAKMIGVRLRDAELSAYGNQETTAN